jgi:hypothetical protein
MAEAETAGSSGGTADVIATCCQRQTFDNVAGLLQDQYASTAPAGTCCSCHIPQLLYIFKLHTVCMHASTAAAAAALHSSGVHGCLLALLELQYLAAASQTAAARRWASSWFGARTVC